MHGFSEVKRVGTDGPMVEVGPDDPQHDYVLRVPRSFVRKLTLVESAETVEAHCEYLNEKIQIVELRISKSDSGITSSLLQEISVPELIEECARSAIPTFSYWESNDWRGQLTNSELRSYSFLLAKIYWFEYAIGGSPRKRIQQELDCHRNTANYYITKTNKHYALPSSRNV